MLARDCVVIAISVASFAAGCRGEPMRTLDAPAIEARLETEASGADSAGEGSDRPDLAAASGIRAQIAELASSADARLIEAIAPIDGGALVLLGQADATGLDWTSFVLRDGHRGPAWAVDRARQANPASAAAAPRVVSLDGGPMIILSASDNLGRVGQNASLAVRLVRADGRIDDASRWLLLDSSIVFDGAWSAASAGTRAVVCFAGRGVDTVSVEIDPGPARDLFCGTLDREGVWERQPTRVFAAGERDGHAWTVRAIHVGTGLDGTVLVAMFVAGPEHDRVLGLLLDTTRWDFSLPLDLGAPRVPEPASFAWRRLPLILTTSLGTAYALPGSGTATPFAGWLGPDGQRRGETLTISELGTPAERTVLAEVAGTPVLVYDLPGVSATRSVVAFDQSTPFVADLERVSGSIERNGPAAGGLMSLVVDHPDGAELWVLDAETLGQTRDPARPVRAATWVRLPEPEYTDAGHARATQDAGGHEADAGQPGTTRE